MCLVELLSLQLGKLLPRESFENDTSLIHVIETNHMFESYLKIRQHVPREISSLSSISRIYVVGIFLNECANMFYLWGLGWDKTHTISKESSSLLNP